VYIHPSVVNPRRSRTTSPNMSSTFTAWCFISTRGRVSLFLRERSSFHYWHRQWH
jgi:hypothetical protein